MTLTDAASAHPSPPEQINFPALADHLSLTLVKALGRSSWLARRTDGTLVVLKGGCGVSLSDYDFLLKMGSLYPPFAYPQNVTGKPGHFLVYDFIPGTPLSAGDFEAAAVHQAVFDLSGRLTALFRSLKLAPMMQGLHRQSKDVDQNQGPSAQRLAALGASMGQRQDSLAVRRWEASQSYAWAQQILSWCRKHWPAGDSLPLALWSALQDAVADITSIHLAVHGSSLAHTAFSPEHILLGPNDTWGVVGWRVAPRPYNYMRYRFLAWCLVHSPQGDLENRYTRYLSHMPAIHSAAAHPLTFALTLLETWVAAEGIVSHREEKLQVIQRFMAKAMAPPG